MNLYTKTVQGLIAEFERLPGIGRKTVLLQNRGVSGIRKRGGGWIPTHTRERRERNTMTASFSTTQGQDNETIAIRLNAFADESGSRILVRRRCKALRPEPTSNESLLRPK